MISTAEWHQELKTRRKAIWEIVEKHGCDTGLIYGSHDHSEPFRYVTNFVPELGDMWGVLYGPVRLTNILNFHWQLIEARQKSGLTDWYGYFDCLPAVIEALAANSPKHIAVLGLDRMPAKAYQVIQDRLGAVTLIDAGEDFIQLRKIKSGLEIQLLRQAAQITSESINRVRGDVRPGISEHEMVAKLVYATNLCGGELAFSPTVMSGNADSGIIRAPVDRYLGVGETVMIDYGASYSGYQADVSRTYVLGHPSDLQKRVWETVLAAYQAVLELAHPGVPCIALH